MFSLENLCVVLVQARNPLNIGAAARAMSNFGARQLRVVNPYAPAYREARSAVGAADLLAHSQQFGALAPAIADCSLIVGTTAIGHREVQHPLHLLAPGARKIRNHLRKGRVALLFGSEKRGLSNEDLSHCHWLLHIPARKEHRSMNLGQAVAVCLYELARDSTHSKPSEHTPPVRGEKPATLETIHRVSEVLLEAIERSGYVKPRGGRTAEEKLRRMIRRFQLQEADAQVFLGMLRKILWKLDSTGQPAKAAH